jgi:hypothetical protein
VEYWPVDASTILFVHPTSKCVNVFFFHVRVSEWARAGSCGGNIILQYIFYDIIYLYKDNSL